MSTITIIIPTYEMHGKGASFLKESFEYLKKQTYTDFDIVISDNSEDEDIKNICDDYTSTLTLTYVKNPDPHKGMSSNVNNGIRHATGSIIKILFLDDFLFDTHALEKIASSFDLEKDFWLVTGCIHTTDGAVFDKPHSPTYNKKMLSGENTIGSPSVLAIKNDRTLFFDTHLKWLMDCDYYARMYAYYGEPKIIPEPLVAIRTGDHQVTKSVDKNLDVYEKKYLQIKHKKRMRDVLELPMVTLVAVSGIDPDGAAKALELSMDGVNFYDAVVISHKPPKNADPRITFKKCKDTELASTDPKNKDDYSRFMAYDLHAYIDTPYALIVHNDALVLRPKKWTDDFLKYDYIGAPWPEGIHFTNEGVNVRVGNGGFSLRSARLLNILNELNLPFTDNGTGFYNEDGIISVYYRKALEDVGIAFAPTEIASLFSREVDCPDSVSKPFGYHNNKKAIPLFFKIKHHLRKLL